ncbi:hypothetical protein SCUCBS95973_002090 [Sporothrix curviconia]|uniref:C3hc zinc finger protein n=1 Tax=Sporothrix curviconia TaxID=1260050 RepID=A0ABP0B429_9PEZI
MNATKRKFNALLQGIGTRSTGSVSTADKNEPLRPSSLDTGWGGDAGSSSYIGSTSASPAAARAGGATTTTTTTTPAKQDMLYSSATRSATATATATGAPTSSAVASLEFLAKRRRIANGGGATLRDTTGNATTTPSSSLLQRWGTQTKTSTTLAKGTTAAAAAAATLQPAPRYAPGDREQLLRRLATFQELTDWAPKPDRINEIEWAKRGWVCQGKERLRCTLCSKELVVQLGRSKSDETSSGDAAGTGAGAADAAAAAEAAVVDKYVDLVVAAHEEDCLWRKKGCDDSLLRLQLASPRQALADLRQRYDELCGRKDFLPYEFNLRLPDGLDIDAVLATLPPTFFDNSNDSCTSSPPPNRTALALAVMGWQGLTNSRIGAVPNSASCHACLRRLGLWMFKSKQVDLETNTVLEPAPMDHLDAVREHRFFCPWKNGAVQRNPGARTGRGNATKGSKGSSTAEAPGWDVLVQMLKNDAYLRNRVGAGPSSRRPLTAGIPGTSSKDASAAVVPVTPGRRPATAAGNDEAVLAGTPVTPNTTPGGGLFGNHETREEDNAARDAKDKERWARLRRVKSLFDNKGTMAKKLKRAGVGGSSSRPGTGHSTYSTPRPESQG